MSDPHNQGLYSKKVIADLFNLSERRVEQLVQKKIIPKAGRGVFDLGSTVQAYIRYLQGLCSGAIKSGEPSELDRRLLEARVLERESKARQAKYRADAMEQEIQTTRLHKEIQRIPDKLTKRLTERTYDTQLIEAVRQEAGIIIAEILKDGDSP